MAYIEKPVDGIEYTVEIFRLQLGGCPATEINGFDRFVIRILLA